ncbi:hypothetical protein PVAP13_9NG191319 [Panicum virgatum]|uniref:Uncharacterized protein n=1 Tax=Panicum virgatum TaxID=38727 RepID=A0A8T0MKD5_PANVG|nr:hypothetical protein PVAP13_9NG191319 [Panicum virgatum]
MRRQGARRNACARRRRACSPASAPRGPPPRPSRSRRPRAWGVLTSPRQRRGRAGGRWASDSGSGREMSPSARCFLFFFPSVGLGLPIAAPPPSRPCHALFASFSSTSIVSPRFVPLLFCRVVPPRPDDGSAETRPESTDLS